MPAVSTTPASRSAPVLAGGDEFVASGGSASATTVSSGGVLYVSSGGVANGTQIKSGGLEYVSSGGLDSGAGVSWAQFVLAGGTASGATISNAGGQYDFGVTVSTVLAGGEEFVASGGSASATTVSSGGVLYVSSGGVANHAVIDNGGTAYVSSGGTAIGTIFSGGTEVMSAGAVASGTFDFASNGDLVIDQTSGTFGASISGLTNSGQILDFANIASSGASVSYSNSGTSGTLTVTNGTNSVSVNLIGTYSAGSFKSANDGSGGIEVYDPSLVPNGGIGNFLWYKQFDTHKWRQHDGWRSIQRVRIQSHAVCQLCRRVVRRAGLWVEHAGFRQQPHSAKFGEHSDVPDLQSASPVIAGCARCFTKRRLCF